MQKQIHFVEKWIHGKHRSATWSGTPYGVYSALERNGVVVKDVPLGESSVDRLLSKINHVFHKLIGKNDFYMFDVKLGERELKHKVFEGDGPNLFFTQYRFDGVENSYYFMDYSVQFLDRMRKAGADFLDYTPLKSSVSNRDLSRRLRIANECANRCKGYFTMSKYLAKDLIENDHIPESKVHWVGGGYNLDISKIDGKNRTGRRFLFIGTTWETKNGPLIVEAFEKLRKKYSDIELWIIGPKKEPEEVRGKAGIQYKGRIPHSQVVDYYNVCDFFVMPSKADAYGIVFSEALVCGLPCIGKNILAMPEFIEDGKSGYLLDNEDVDELASLMEKILVNRDSLCRYIDEKHDFYVEYYSWDSVAKRMIEAIQKDGYWG